MNAQFEDLMYRSGLTAQGCWDEFDDYTREAIEVFGVLVVEECLQQVDSVDLDEHPREALGRALAGLAIARYFGV